MKIVRCDRCGLEFEKAKPDKYFLVRFGYKQLDHYGIDLCPVCQDSLDRWMRIGGNNENIFAENH